MADYSIGVVGLGRMGSGIAARLVETDFDVVGYDLDETARANAADVGVDVRSTAAAVATGCDIVVTSLPTPGAVRAAYTASDGLLSSGASFVAVEMSTIDPDTTLAIAEQAADAGITFVDAPVSGGPKDATRGTLTVLVGGPASVIESEPVTRLLTTIADTRHHVGDVGAGHTAKLVNNVMSMGNLLVAMEAVSLGVRRGLDGELLLDALANAGGSSNQFRKRLPRVLNRNFEAGFTVTFGRKDLRLALDAAHESTHSMPMTGLVYQLFSRAVQEGYAEEDVGAVAKLFEVGGATIEAEGTVNEAFDGY